MSKILNDVQNCVLLNVMLTNGQILIFYLLQNFRWRGMLHACSALISSKYFHFTAFKIAAYCIGMYA